MTELRRVLRCVATALALTSPAASAQYSVTDGAGAYGSMPLEAFLELARTRSGPCPTLHIGTYGEYTLRRVRNAAPSDARYALSLFIVSHAEVQEALESTLRSDSRVTGLSIAEFSSERAFEPSDDELRALRALFETYENHRTTRLERLSIQSLPIDIEPLWNAAVRWAGGGGRIGHVELGSGTERLAPVRLETPIAVDSVHLVSAGYGAAVTTNGSWRGPVSLALAHRAIPAAPSATRWRIGAHAQSAHDSDPTPALSLDASSFYRWPAEAGVLRVELCAVEFTGQSEGEARATTFWVQDCRRKPDDSSRPATVGGLVVEPRDKLLRSEAAWVAEQRVSGTLELRFDATTRHIDLGGLVATSAPTRLVATTTSWDVARAMLEGAGRTPRLVQIALPELALGSDALVEALQLVAASPSVTRFELPASALPPELLTAPSGTRSITLVTAASPTAAHAFGIRGVDGVQFAAAPR